MSLLGVLLGKPGPAAAPAPPPLPPSPTAGSTPVAAPDSGAGTASATDHDTGAGTGGASSGSTGSMQASGQAAAQSPEAAFSALQAAASGTPVTAPATRHAFGLPEEAPASEERERAYALASQRKWRMADVVAAIGGGPRAQLLIEAASRPGPVQPGSLLEAVKALRPAPTLPELTRTV